MDENWFCFRNTFFLQTKYNYGESESLCYIVDVVCYRTVANTRLPLFLSDTLLVKPGMPLFVWSFDVYLPIELFTKGATLGHVDLLRTEQ